MKELKVGERIRIYYAVGAPVVGIVTEIKGDIVYFKTKEARNCFAHRKQCRLLKKKEPREWWVNVFKDDPTQAYIHNSKDTAIAMRTNSLGVVCEAETILVREVIERKK